MTDIDHLRAVLHASWDAATCDPHDLPWSAANPSRGQCGVTALVVQEILGGELVLGEVFQDGAKVGYHYWNRLPNGREVDFTAEQFHPGEEVRGGAVQQRPAGGPGRCREQYELLRTRVSALR
jgi:hypothetical protein